MREDISGDNPKIEVTHGRFAAVDGCLGGVSIRQRTLVQFID
jgi:hypothetical protein